MSESLTWIAADGTELSLIDPNTYFWQRGTTGLDMPPIVYQGQQIPLQSGEIPRLILAGPRDVLVPLLLKGTSRANFFDNKSALYRAFYVTNPKKLGTLRYNTPNGHTRDLYCLYQSGAEGDTSIDNSGVAHMGIVAHFRSPSPFWYDAAATILTLVPDGVQTFFQNPFFPLHLSADGQSDSFTIDNTGDDVCYPTWQIAGPCSNPRLSNTFVADNGATLTKTIALTLDLADGESLTIKTKYGEGSIKKQDGSSQFAAMDPTSELWPLVRGINQCAISLTSPGSNTLVRLTYQQAYLAP